MYIVSFLKRAAESFPLHSFRLRFTSTFNYISSFLIKLIFIDFLSTYEFFLVKQELTGTAYKMTPHYS